MRLGQSLPATQGFTPCYNTGTHIAHHAHCGPGRHLAWALASERHVAMTGLCTAVLSTSHVSLTFSFQAATLSSISTSRVEHLLRALCSPLAVTSSEHQSQGSPVMWASLYRKEAQTRDQGVAKQTVVTELHSNTNSTH